MAPWVNGELKDFGLDSPDSLGLCVEKTVTEAANRLEQLNKKLYTRHKGKPKSKLVNGKKTKIPGFSYYFSRD